MTDRRGDARDRRRLAALAAAPAVVLALLGLAHPADLTTETAPAWTTLHVVLLPLFPLLGLPVLLLLRGERPPVIWGVGIALLIYAAFYTALDVLAGIATGTLVQRGADPEGGEVRALFDTGNGLSVHGVWAFVVAAAVTAAVVVRRVGQSALPGALLLVAAAVVFTGAHIYWPVGGLAMLGLAAGFALLALAGPHRPATTAPPGDDGQ